MTLDDATHVVLAAAVEGDLAALEAALETRGRLIREGAPPTPDAIKAGELACVALTALKQRWGFESARLTQLQSGFAVPEDYPTVDLRG